MITLNYLVRKKADISAEDFAAYWLDEHAIKSIETAHKMGVGRYTKQASLDDNSCSRQWVSLLIGYFSLKSDLRKTCKTEELKDKHQGYFRKE